LETYEAFGAVLFVLVLLGAVLWLLRQRGVAVFSMPAGMLKSGGTRQLEVLDRVALGPQHGLYMVRVGDSKWLVGTAPGGCRLEQMDRETRQ